jgi:UDP-N-acetylmuramoyl-L-alanyl-D-glutamate--2,6-diaminopimelate ligase
MSDIDCANTDRTTPESYDLQSLFADMNEKAVQNVVMEVSSQGLALDRVACCEYDIGVFTNISRDHIGPKEHADFDDYLKAKTILFRMCKKGLINIDAVHSDKIIENASCKLYTYAVEKDADIKAADVQYHRDSVEFSLLTPWGNTGIKVKIPGKFTVYNALAAIGTCCLMDIPFADIKAGLENVSVPGRAEVVETGRDFTVMVDYAHTPDSLENILTTVKGFAKGRVISVFGCGGDRDRMKRPMMGEISGRIADLTIITSDNPRTEDPLFIIGQIEEGIKKVTASYITIVDRKEAITYAIEHAHSNDVIVIAGKGHEPYQIFRNETIHFDDREVAREILGKLD